MEFNTIENKKESNEKVLQNSQEYNLSFIHFNDVYNLPPK
jgi:hypothetical protein